jgi:hypothetical protein
MEGGCNGMKNPAITIPICFSTDVNSLPGIIKEVTAWRDLQNRRDGAYSRPHTCYFGSADIAA